MKLTDLLILTILLKTTIVESSKCTNPNLKCIELCCEMHQIYVETEGRCSDLAEFPKTRWLAFISNSTRLENVSFKEYGKCSLTPQKLVIDNCYGPNFYNDMKDIKLIQYFSVPCGRLKETDLLLPIFMGLTILMLSPLCLPILLLFTCIKKNKKNWLSYKLISWYLTSMSASLLTLLLWTYFQLKETSQDILLSHLLLLFKFFEISTFLWLSCIGYNVYVKFKEANMQNTEYMNRLRFIWFSFYVWGGSLTISIICKMIESSDLVTDVPVYLIAYFNVFAFLIMAMKICWIRCRVIALTTEKHIKCKLARVICRLCILMGIPRMMFMILVPIIGIYAFFIMLLLEPYLVYGTFISENENCCTLFCCKCCRYKSNNEENERPSEDIRMRSDITMQSNITV